MKRYIAPFYVPWTEIKSPEGRTFAPPPEVKGSSGILCVYASLEDFAQDHPGETALLIEIADTLEPFTPQDAGGGE